jgi:hypothetical protein
MKTFLASLLWCSTAFGQIAVPTTTIPYEPIVAAVTVPSTGDSQVLWDYPPAVKAIQVDAKTLHVWAPPGSHTLGATVITIDWESKRFNALKHSATFAVSGSPTPPPGPGPAPPTPPVPSGKLTAIIFEESEDHTPAFARRLVQLRTGTAASYLKSKGHTLKIVDDDSTHEDGATTAMIAKIKAAGVSMPLLAVFNEAGELVKIMPLPDSVTADNVVETLRQLGG